MSSSISIRPVIEADLETLFEYESDPVAQEMAVFGARDHESFMAHWHKILADEDLVARAVVVDGGLAGNIGSWTHDGKRYVGYWIGRDFWGRGIATEALRALCAEIIERPIYALVADSNVGSKRVLEKAGFAATTDEPTAGHDGVREWLYRLD